MCDSEAQCGGAQNGTGVMASQTEIHLNPNDVINAAERTVLSCVGKPSHVSLNIHLYVHMCDCIHEQKFTKFYPEIIN